MFHICHNQFGSSFLFVHLLVLFREKYYACVLMMCGDVLHGVCVYMHGHTRVHDVWGMHVYVHVCMLYVCMHGCGTFMWKSEDNCVKAGLFHLQVYS